MITIIISKSRSSLHPYKAPFIHLSVYDIAPPFLIFILNLFSA